jgi:hypothetical protein
MPCRERFSREKERGHHRLQNEKFVITIKRIMSGWKMTDDLRSQ